MVNFGDLANSTRARVKFRRGMRKIQEQRALLREARWPELCAATIGAKLGAKIHGAELMPRPRYTGSHISGT